MGEGNREEKMQLLQEIEEHKAAEKSIRS